MNNYTYAGVLDFSANAAWLVEILLYNIKKDYLVPIFHINMYTTRIFRYICYVRRKFIDFRSISRHRALHLTQKIPQI